MFRLIEDTFWDDPPITALTRDEKLILICLFTNIHTRPCGIYRIGLDRISMMTKVQEAAVEKGMKHLAAGDLVYHDGLEVCIPGYIRKQRYKGPQMAHRIAVELSQVKNKSFVQMIVKRYPDYLRMGGFKIDGAEIASPQMELSLESEEAAKPRPAAGLADLAAFIATRLRFTGGVKSMILAGLVKQDPDGEAGVRKAVKRAEKYFETAKAEKWRSYVMARRFSKFCDFYGEAFSSDEALEIYIEKIRLANERERKKDEWHKKRAASLQVGAQRPEPIDPPADPWIKFMERLPAQLESLRKDFEGYRKGKTKAEYIKGKLVGLFSDDKELNLKTEHFARNLNKEMVKPEIMQKYRTNYLLGKFAIPAMED
jgi:hypothetical protein